MKLQLKVIKDSNDKNIYEFESGHIDVIMQYSKNDKSFEECMLNIVREKCNLKILEGI